MPDRIHQLAIRQLEGTLSDDQRAELAALLTSDAEARRVYLAHMQDTASLRWMFSGRLSRKTAVTLAAHGPEGVKAARKRRTAWLALATGAALAFLAALPFLWSQREYVATITDVTDVEWASADGAHRPLARVAAGEEFEFTAGTLELAFDTYAKVQIFGPAKFTVCDSKSIDCTRGRVTTHVEEGGKGFTIQTPKARIVDLGTEFGVDISEMGDTQVVVFQGSVDLTKAAPDSEKHLADANQWTRTLEQGDALLLDHTGETQRVMSVKRRDFFPANLFDHYGRRRRAPLITDVRDNIRELESTKCYQIVWGGLREDAPSFVDRQHQWNGKTEAGMPEFLLGADYIMPFNDDKFTPDLQVEVELAGPATCYVFFDDNMPPPAWLLKDFEDTGFDLALDGARTQWHRAHNLGKGPGASVDFPFSIWRRDVPEAGVVRFGGVQPPKDRKRSAGFNMYGIAVAPM
ncbi:MAG TPA: FecR family protein [Lacipirellula sp.]